NNAGALFVLEPGRAECLWLQAFVVPQSQILADMLLPRETGQASRGSTELAEVLGLEPNPSQRRCSEFFNGLLANIQALPTGRAQRSGAERGRACGGAPDSDRC